MVGPGNDSDTIRVCKSVESIVWYVGLEAIGLYDLSALVRRYPMSDAIGDCVRGG